MADVTYDIRVEAGVPFELVFNPTDAAGVSIPFATGTTAMFQVRASRRATGAPLVSTAPVVDAPLGVLTLSLTAEETRSLDIPRKGSFVYAIEISAPGENDRRFAEGKLTCSSEVVR